MTLRRSIRLITPAVLVALAGIAPAAAVTAPELEITVQRATAPSAARAANAVDGLGCNGPLIGNGCVAARCTNCQAPIPDQGELSQTLTISAEALASLGLANCVIHDVNVGVELTHGSVGDLAIDFVRPGPETSLYFPPASCAATAVDAIFDDEAGGPPNACPATGGLILPPDGTLTAFDNGFLAGDWTLEVFDLLPGDAGMMGQWGFAADVTCDVVADVCVPGPTTLCLRDDRFRVEVEWRTPLPSNGVGQAFELTPDTGYFWFFNPNNVEMVLKVLNGCPINNHFWVFAGGLTNVEVEMTVTDTQTRQVKTYTNPLNKPFQPIQDTAAFATCP